MTSSNIKSSFMLGILVCLLCTLSIQQLTNPPPEGPANETTTTPPDNTTTPSDNTTVIPSADGTNATNDTTLTPPANTTTVPTNETAPPPETNATNPAVLNVNITIRAVVLYFSNNISFYQIPPDAFTQPSSSLTFTATLADGSPLPPWMILVNDTFYFLNNESTTIPITISLTATDFAGNTASQTFTITEIHNTLVNELQPPFTLVNTTEQQIFVDSAVLPNDNIFVAYVNSTRGLNGLIMSSQGDILTPNISVTDGVSGAAAEALLDNSIVITWIIGSPDGLFYQVFAKIIDENGGELVPAFLLINSGFSQVPIYKINSLETPAFVVIWTLPLPDGTNNIWAKVYDSRANITVDERVLIAGIMGNTTNPDIKTLPSGNLIMAFENYENVTNSNIIVQYYNASLIPLTAFIKVNELAQGDLRNPHLLVISNTSVFVQNVWLDTNTSFYLVNGNFIDQTGEFLQGPESPLYLGQFTGTLPRFGLSLTGQEKILLTWNEACPEIGGEALFGSIYETNATLIPSLFNITECATLQDPWPATLNDTSQYFFYVKDINIYAKQVNITYS